MLLLWLLDFLFNIHLHWLSFLCTALPLVPFISHHFPLLLMLLLPAFPQWFHDSYFAFFFLLAFYCFFWFTTLSPPTISPFFPGDSSLLTNFSVTFSLHSPPPRFSFTSLISTSHPRAAVPGRAPPVQAAAGSWWRVLLRKLPVGSPKPWLCSHRGRAPTWWWSHCRGYWETALPNGGYVRRLEWHLFCRLTALQLLITYINLPEQLWLTEAQQ